MLGRPGKRGRRFKFKSPPKKGRGKELGLGETTSRVPASVPRYAQGNPGPAQLVRPRASSSGPGASSAARLKKLISSRRLPSQGTWQACSSAGQPRRMVTGTGEGVTRARMTARVEAASKAARIYASSVYASGGLAKFVVAFRLPEDINLEVAALVEPLAVGWPRDWRADSMASRRFLSLAEDT